MNLRNAIQRELQQNTSITILRISVIESEYESDRQTDKKNGSQTRVRAGRDKKNKHKTVCKITMVFILSTR